MKRREVDGQAEEHADRVGEVRGRLEERVTKAVGHVEDLGAHVLTSDERVDLEVLRDILDATVPPHPGSLLGGTVFDRSAP